MMDAWLEPTEANVFCEVCGDVVYMGMSDFCSEECEMEYYKLTEVDVMDELESGNITDATVCECCGTNVQEWSTVVKDLDGNFYCDVDCYMRCL